jgi:uncharacterized membrane protein (UPF0127 family)
MPNPNEAKKTASAPNIRRKFILVALVIGLAVAIAVTTLWPKTSPVTLRMDGRTYTLEIARTASQQQKGLGERPSMPHDHGMLFAYSISGRYCYWMKGMQFPLDIIWLDANKRVIETRQNLSPNTYPESYCPSGSSTRYVIELNAGQAAEMHLRAGQQLDF